ncbi:MAG TPA: hypothetical protein VK191_06230 [Symbiobacteriaceae bacterium]|nr:hypothetical protein [Symbiobacteriaceae bacterium]
MAVHPHTLIVPYSRSVAPAPIVDEASVLAQLPDGPVARARSIAWRAWFATGAERYELAAEALALDPQCSDAFLLIAELEPEWHPRQNKFERAVSAASFHSGREGWIESTPEGDRIRLWIGGPLLRAQIAAARSMVYGGFHWEALQRLRMLLTFCPNEPYALQYELLQLAHQTRDLEVINWTVDFDRSGSCTMAYERLWLALVTRAPRREIARLARLAIRANRYVPALLRKPLEPAPAPSPYAHLLSRFAKADVQLGDMPPKRLTAGAPGSEEEAEAYAAWTILAWQEEDRARDWLLLPPREKV